MKKLLSMLLVLAMAMGMVGTATAAEGPIVIGALQDITGATSSLGNMVYQGALWAANEINANGGVNGRQIELKVYDTTGSVDEAITALIKAITEDNVSAIIGPPVANIAHAIKEITEAYDVPVLGFAVDTATVVKEDGTPYKNMFLFQPSADQQANIMASNAMEQGLKNFAILYNEANAYSVSLLPEFKATVTGNGGTITDELAYNASDRDFKTLLTKIIANNPDGIYVPNYTADLTLIAQEANALGYKGKLVCGLDACPPFNTTVGLTDLANIMFINNVDDTEKAMADLIVEVKEKVGIDATNKFFLGYDVMNILAGIVGEVGDKPADVAAAVCKVAGYQGLTGNITINPDTHMTEGLEMVMFTYEGITPVMLKRYAAQ